MTMSKEPGGYGHDKTGAAGGTTGMGMLTTVGWISLGGGRSSRACFGFSVLIWTIITRVCRTGATCTMARRPITAAT